MSIDWVTVVAQLLNFLVLVWLLKRFLYRPILDGIDAREKEIAERMAEAAKVRETAQAAHARHQAEIAALHADRHETLEGVRRIAQAEHDNLLAQARERLAAKQASQAAQRAEEARRYTIDLHRSGAEALLSLTRKALSDLADEILEQRIIAHCTAQLGEAAEQLRAAGGDSHEVVALTHEPLPPDLATHLRNELGRVLPGVSVRFETDPSLAWGLTLKLGGAQAAWTLDSYLDALHTILEDFAARATATTATVSADA
ncbi:ATP synthase subunit B [Steroidobacter denitrificans]|uniref:ATP synthase subunit b n=1 Tax=Steroidobacter denitrificans TaxID=465721 RepID=A0A127FE17_STEDE|nr:ATP synthase subunit B [Steroidobacter denitrificans]AMN48001.1 ATP synthase subunit B [Steroidobacter denitrificans]